MGDYLKSKNANSAWDAMRSNFKTKEESTNAPTERFPNLKKKLKKDDEDESKGYGSSHADVKNFGSRLGLKR